MPVRLKVKEIAEQKRISQRQLFLRSGVDTNIIRRIYRDPYANITVQTLGKLAVVLGVDVSELVENAPNGKKPHDEQSPSQEDENNG